MGAKEYRKYDGIPEIMFREQSLPNKLFFLFSWKRGMKVVIDHISCPEFDTGTVLLDRGTVFFRICERYVRFPNMSLSEPHTSVLQKLILKVDIFHLYSNLSHETCWFSLVPRAVPRCGGDRIFSNYKAYTMPGQKCMGHNDPRPPPTVAQLLRLIIVPCIYNAADCVPPLTSITRETYFCPLCGTVLIPRRVETQRVRLARPQPSTNKQRT